MTHLSDDKIKELRSYVDDAEELSRFMEKTVWKRVTERVEALVSKQDELQEIASPNGSVDQVVADLQTLWLRRGLRRAVRVLQSSCSDILKQGDDATKKLAERRSD